MSMGHAVHRLEDPAKRRRLLQVVRATSVMLLGTAALFFIGAGMQHANGATAFVGLFLGFLGACVAFGSREPSASAGETDYLDPLVAKADVGEGAFWSKVLGLD